MADGVRFIRRNGRIIPIRSKKGKISAVERAKVGYQFGAGVGVSVGSFVGSIQKIAATESTTQIVGKVVKGALKGAAAGAAAGGVVGAVLIGALGPREGKIHPKFRDKEGNYKAKLLQPGDVAFGLAGTALLGKRYAPVLRAAGQVASKKFAKVIRRWKGPKLKVIK